MRANKFILTIMAIFIFFSCMTGSPAKSDYDIARRSFRNGDYAGFLEHISKAVLADRKAEPVYKELSKYGLSAVGQFESFFQTTETSNDPSVLAKRFFSIRSMVNFYKNIEIAGMPISDSKGKYVFRTEIKNYSADLEEARREAYNIFFYLGKKYVEQIEISKSLGFFQTALKDFQIINTESYDKALKDIIDVYEKFCNLNYTSPSIEVRLASYDALVAIKKFNPYYDKIREMEINIKTSIANYYYEKGLQAEKNYSEQSIKEAISFYDKTIYWIFDYKDVQIRKDRLIVLFEINNLNSVFKKLKVNVVKADSYLAKRFDFNVTRFDIDNMVSTFNHYKKTKNNLTSINETLTKNKNYEPIEKNILDLDSTVLAKIEVINKVVSSYSDYKNINIDNSLKSISNLKSNYNRVSDICYKFKRSVLQEERTLQYLSEWVMKEKNSSLVKDAQIKVKELVTVLEKYDNAFIKFSDSYENGVASATRLGQYSLYFDEAKKRVELCSEASNYGKESLDGAVKLIDTDFKDKYKAFRDGNVSVNEMLKNVEFAGKVLKIIVSLKKVPTYFNEIYLNNAVIKTFEYIYKYLEEDDNRIEEFSKSMEMLSNVDNPDSIVEKFVQLENFKR